jgi:hypothetical protein
MRSLADAPAAVEVNQSSPRWDAPRGRMLAARYEAWWEGELARPLVRLTAPLGPGRLEDVPQAEAELHDWLTNPDRVLPRLESQVANTYCAGDAFPVVFPMYTGIPAILAVYLGCHCRLMPDGPTGWLSPVIEEWGARPNFALDPDEPWWSMTRRLLVLAAERSNGRYAVGIPDLQGGGEILAMLRGSQRLAFDLRDDPGPIVPAIAEINAAWLECYWACYEIIHRHSSGYVDWLGLWSDRPAVTVECDFAALISPRMFDTYFLPGLAQQVEWIGRTIFHLDGPRALPHLDTLLNLKGLTGIQWGPGDGAPPVSEWIPLLRRIQDAGKLQVLICESWEVPLILAQLKPDGLCFSTGCASPGEADDLMAEVDRITHNSSVSQRRSAWLS